MKQSKNGYKPSKIVQKMFRAREGEAISVMLGGARGGGFYQPVRVEARVRSFHDGHFEIGRASCRERVFRGV